MISKHFPFLLLLWLLDCFCTCNLQVKVHGSQSREECCRVLYFILFLLIQFPPIPDMWPALSLHTANWIHFFLIGAFHWGSLFINTSYSTQGRAFPPCDLLLLTEQFLSHQPGWSQQKLCSIGGFLDHLHWQNGKLLLSNDRKIMVNRTKSTRNSCKQFTLRTRIP